MQDRGNKQATPFNCHRTLDDEAHTDYFLESEQGNYINGQTIALGGWSTMEFLVHDPLSSKRGVV